MAAVSRRSAPVAVAALVGANLLPLAGVTLWGWSVFEVLLLYWLESGVVGALNVPKILLAAGSDDGATAPSDGLVDWQVEGLPTDWVAGRSGPLDNLGTALFFVFHYGVFWVVHGAFVFALPLFAMGTGLGRGPGVGVGPFGGPGTGPVGTVGGFAGWGALRSPATLLLAVASMALSHSVSLVTNYVRGGEYRTISPARQMMRPYGRVTTLHLTILVGAFLVASFGSPLPALLLLVVLKTLYDVREHLREHRTGDRTLESA